MRVFAPSLAHRVIRREVHHKTEEGDRTMSWVKGWANCHELRWEWVTYRLV